MTLLEIFLPYIKYIWDNLFNRKIEPSIYLTNGFFTIIFSNYYHNFINKNNFKKCANNDLYDF